MPYCGVLPHGKFNGMIPQPLVHCESFMTMAVTVLLILVTHGYKPTNFATMGTKNIASPFSVIQ